MNTCLKFSFFSCLFLASCGVQIQSQTTAPAPIKYSIVSKSDSLLSIRKSPSGYFGNNRDISDRKGLSNASPQSGSIKVGKKIYSQVYAGDIDVFLPQSQYVGAGFHNFNTRYDLFLRKGSALQQYSPTLLIKMVDNNPEAYRAAKASSFYSGTAKSSLVVFVGGLSSYLLLPKGSVRDGAGIVGLASAPLWLISIPLANSKMKKAICLHNTR